MSADKLFLAKGRAFILSYRKQRVICKVSLFKAAAPRAGIGIPVKNPPYVLVYGGFSVLWASD